MKHELTHSVFRIRNNKDNCYKDESYPYCDASEKKEYNSSLADLSKRLKNLKSRLSKNITQDKILSEKDQSIVDKLSMPFDINVVYKESLSKLKKGDTTYYEFAKNHLLKTIPVILIEDAYSDKRQVSLGVKFENPVLNALAAIDNYEKSTDMVRNNPAINAIDKEQPAYMMQYLEEALSLISPKMNRYISKILKKCAKEPETSVENPKALRYQIKPNENERDGL